MQEIVLVVWLFLLRETSETLRHFVLLYQNNATSSPGLVGCRPFFWLLPCTTDVIFADMAKVFLIWSRLAGYVELAVGVEPITSGEIF